MENLPLFPVHCQACSPVESQVNCLPWNLLQTLVLFLVLFQACSPVWSLASFHRRNLLRFPVFRLAFCRAWSQACCRLNYQALNQAIHPLKSPAKSHPTRRRKHHVIIFPHSPTTLVWVGNVDLVHRSKPSLLVSVKPFARLLTPRQYALEHAVSVRESGRPASGCPKVAVCTRIDYCYRNHR